MCSAGEQAPMYAAQGDKHMPVQFDQRMQIFNEFKDLHACEQLIQKQLFHLIGDRLVPLF
jgi:hypothetical protein